MKYAIIEVNGEPQVAYVIESPEDLEALFDKPNWHRVAQKHCAEGHRIAAIKAIRLANGWGIAEAKKYIDTYFPFDYNQE